MGCLTSQLCAVTVKQYVSELTASHHSTDSVLHRLMQEPFTYKDDYSSTLSLIGHETWM